MYCIANAETLFVLKQYLTQKLIASAQDIPATSYTASSLW